MTDTSPYTIEEILIAAVGVHDRVLEKRTMTDVSAKFQERFKKPAPKKDLKYYWHGRRKHLHLDLCWMSLALDALPPEWSTWKSFSSQFPILEGNRLVNCNSPLHTPKGAQN
ncbi:hypothetical protein BsWGS_02839 [Bradybaena similaris]